MLCRICEVRLSADEFPEGSPICKSCVAKLIKIYGVEYSAPIRQSKVTAHLSLILAIRKSAVNIGELDDFEAYWLNTSPWNQILRTVYAEARKYDGIKSVVEELDEPML